MKRQSLIDIALASNAISGDLLRWTLGSLLVVNGGALVALLGSDSLRVESFKEAALYFGGGLVTAILGGVCWFFAFSFLSHDQMRRAWETQHLMVDALEDPKARPGTVSWAIGAMVAWLGCFTLFTFGCISMVFIPEQVALRAAGHAHTEATYRFIKSAEALRVVRADPKASLTQREAALDRYNAAQVEVDIASDRVGRALGERSELLNTSGK